MKFINPKYKLKEDNIFNIRKTEYDNLEKTLLQILEPVKEIGFEISEFDIKESKFSSGELFKTQKRNLVIKLKKGAFDIDLSMAIPKMVDSNYITISGRRKLPLFQLFDIPFVTRGKSIKMRTNVASIIVTDKKTFPYVHISIFGKEVPLAFLMMAYFGAEKIGNMFDFDKMIIDEEKLRDFLNEDKEPEIEVSKEMPTPL